MKIKSQVFFENYELQKIYVFGLLKDCLNRLKTCSPERTEYSIYTVQFLTLLPLAERYESSIELTQEEQEVLEEARQKQAKAVENYS